MFQKLFRVLLNQKRISYLIVPLFLANLLFAQNYCYGDTYVCAHRGDVKNAPENTLPAFQLAVKKGVQMIEFDVQMTKDGHLIIMHDSTVNRTTNGQGKVSELTSEEIYKLDAGKWFNEKFEGLKVPSLAEVVSIIPNEILCNVHVYGDEFVTGKVATTLKEMGQVGKCFIACNNEKQVQAAREKVPEIKICLIPERLENRREFVERGIKLKVDYLQVSFTQGLDNLKEDIELAHSHGIKINFFSAQKPEIIKKLVEAKVDYILTDDVDLCFEVLKDYGTKPLNIKM
ncbi:MAG TPA: glycerophosphodiester phosphodiesterase family protein [Candidatus Hydrogenedens sp.]|nr:glycerophosphodiester phosphodiesterase family protein [Candidatus Hydrogenedens sp.]